MTEKHEWRIERLDDDLNWCLVTTGIETEDEGVKQRDSLRDRNPSGEYRCIHVCTQIEVVE